MAAVAPATNGKHMADDEEPEIPKRFKTSELPLSVEQKATIDGLVQMVKKTGIYDKLRREIWEAYMKSVRWYLNLDICPEE